MEKIQSLLALLLNFKSENVNQPPKQVKKFQLKKNVNPNTQDRRFAVGIYVYKNSKVFIKTWTGKMKNFDYYALQNEITANKILRKYIEKLKINHLFTVPKIIEIVESKNQLSIIFEYVDAKTIENISTKEQTKFIKQIIFGLDLISKNLSKQDKKIFPKRNLSWHVEIFLFKILKSNISIKNKLYVTKQILNSYINSQINPSQNNCIAHGDLLPTNILVKKQKTFLVDLGHTAITFPQYDILFLSTQPAGISLVNELLPQGLLMTQTYVAKIIASISLVSTENQILQEYFYKFICA